MLTYQTTRAAKCIYFDGESASLFGTGQLDTQMLHIYGNVTGPPRNPDHRGLWDEYARATGLCDWLKDKELGGPGWGYEGIVRMNAGFEMIWCNFTSSSLRLISHLNVTAPLLSPDEEERVDENAEAALETSYFPLPPTSTRTDIATSPSNPAIPPNWRGHDTQEPFLNSQTWNWFLSGASHYGSNGAGAGLGEARVKIISCGFLNYYSPKFSSLAISRVDEEQKYLNLTKEGQWIGPNDNTSRSAGLNALTRRRRVHTLEKTSPFDAAVMRADSEKVLLKLLHEASNCSYLDWTTVATEIVRTYSGPLSNFLKSIRKYDDFSKSNQTTLRDWMFTIREHTHTFLINFLQYPNGRPEDTIWERHSVLFNETYSRCRFQYTRLLDPEEGLILDHEELTLKWAVEEVTGGICSVLVDVGLSAEALWQRRFNTPRNTSHLQGIDKEVKRWSEGIEELMAWLGWASDWVWCEKKCEWDEKCFIPMWPLIGSRGFIPHRPPYKYRGPPGYEFPPNGTRRRGPEGGYDTVFETGLWNPQCVKSDYFSRG